MTRISSPTLDRKHIADLRNAPDEVSRRFAAIERMVGAEYKERFFAFREEVLSILAQNPDVANDTLVVDVANREIERVWQTMQWHSKERKSRIRREVREASNDDLKTIKIAA